MPNIKTVKSIVKIGPKYNLHPPVFHHKKLTMTTYNLKFIQKFDILLFDFVFVVMEEKYLMAGTWCRSNYATLMDKEHKLLCHVL